jgi:hypothetical protein
MVGRICTKKDFFGVTTRGEKGSMSHLCCRDPQPEDNKTISGEREKKYHEMGKNK